MPDANTTMQLFIAFLIANFFCIFLHLTFLSNIYINWFRYFIFKSFQLPYVKQDNRDRGVLFRVVVVLVLIRHDPG